jgi:hypothetical protein
LGGTRPFGRHLLVVIVVGFDIPATHPAARNLHIYPHSTPIRSEVKIRSTCSVDEQELMQQRLPTAIFADVDRFRLSLCS